MPTAPVHSSAASAVSTGQPNASSKASSRGASPARSTKWESPSARSVKVRTTSVWGVDMRGNIASRRDRDTARERLCLRNQLRFGLDSNDPQAGVDVWYVDQAISIDRAPGIRRIGNDSAGIARHHVSYLAALPQQVTPKLTRDVQHPQSALIIAHVERVTSDPDVVRAAILRLIVGHFPGALDVRDVQHV